MRTIFSSFHTLSPVQLVDIFELRQQVFIIEQNCIYPDIDGWDEKAEHILFYDEEILCAYLRLFGPGIKYVEASLGRIIVRRPYRGSSLGKDLITTGIQRVRLLYPEAPVKIEAQAALENYYKQFGFKSVSDIYMVDDIPHIKMVLKA